jgi:ABC-type multidrug transport system fused ATPase/permease subunit
MHPTQAQESTPSKSSHKAPPLLPLRTHASPLQVPAIDAFSEAGLKPADAPRGALDVDNVSFSYPARADDPVYESLSLSVAPGETLALVRHPSILKTEDVVEVAVEVAFSIETIEA